VNVRADIRIDQISCFKPRHNITLFAEVYSFVVTYFAMQEAEAINSREIVKGKRASCYWQTGRSSVGASSTCHLNTNHKHWKIWKLQLAIGAHGRDKR
jgi:hypothetical protein